EARYRDQVEQDVARQLIETSYREAVEKEDLFPVSNPVGSPDKLEPGQSFRFEARVEVKPEVEAKEYTGLEYEPANPAAVEALVDAELERIQLQLADFVPLEDQEVSVTGDYAVSDYGGTQDGEPIEGA